MTYRSEAGSVTGLSAGASLATPGMDFSSEGENIVLGDGQESATIDVTIVNVSSAVSCLPWPRAIASLH